MIDAATKHVNHCGDRVIQTAYTVANRNLCRDHYRLTLRVPIFPTARAGQFVHLSPEQTSLAVGMEPDGQRRELKHFGPTGRNKTAQGNALGNDPQRESSPERAKHTHQFTALPDGVTHPTWVNALYLPMLRRAFSIAGLRRDDAGGEVDVMYRVVGTATRWMESLGVGDPVSLLGPMGNSFPISDRKPVAWLVAGGVGLPPMLWLAGALQNAHKQVVAFCGAQTRDLLALTLDPQAPPNPSAKTATLTAKEFTEWGASVVISTDDGSLGFQGYVGSAMSAYHQANPIEPDDLVVYTCGPEPMMRFVAEYCVTRGIECFVCVERNMACGTGMCQSCVVPVRDTLDPAGWSYRLCCTDGPIFEARDILWETPT